MGREYPPDQRTHREDRDQLLGGLGRGKPQELRFPFGATWNAGHVAAERMEFVHRSWPAEATELVAIRRELVRWLEPLGLTDDEVADVVLAVDEAVQNAVQHAYRPGEPGRVELTMWTEPDALSIEVVDHGKWRQPADPISVTGTPRGMGIRMMHTMAESVMIHYDERGSRVLLRHRIRRPPSSY